MLKILVCGDRNWVDFLTIYTTLREFNPDLVIQGEARGADTLAKDACDALRIDHIGYHANWDDFGKAAGPIRNQRMLEEQNPDLVLAFHNNLDESKGTKHMVTIARKAGVRTIVINDRGERTEPNTLF